jgi:hypothetical protein
MGAGQEEREKEKGKRKYKRYTKKCDKRPEPVQEGILKMDY